LKQTNRGRETEPKQGKKLKQESDLTKNNREWVSNQTKIMWRWTSWSLAPAMTLNQNPKKKTRNQLTQIKSMPHITLGMELIQAIKEDDIKEPN